MPDSNLVSLNCTSITPLCMCVSVIWSEICVVSVCLFTAMPLSVPVSKLTNLTEHYNNDSIQLHNISYYGRILNYIVKASHRFSDLVSRRGRCQMNLSTKCYSSSLGNCTVLLISPLLCDFQPYFLNTNTYSKALWSTPYWIAVGNGTKERRKVLV